MRLVFSHGVINLSLFLPLCLLPPFPPSIHPELLCVIQRDSFYYSAPLLCSPQFLLVFMVYQENSSVCVCVFCLDEGPVPGLNGASSEEETIRVNYWHWGHLSLTHTPTWSLPFTLRRSLTGQLMLLRSVSLFSCSSRAWWVGMRKRPRRVSEVTLVSCFQCGWVSVHCILPHSSPDVILAFSSSWDLWIASGV